MGQVWQRTTSVAFVPARSCRIGRTTLGGVTPDELELITGDGIAVTTAGDAFSRRFYETLFEIAPTTRALFPDDLVAQRGKLVDELTFLVEAAASSRTQHDLGVFIDRARELGVRHAGYGVAGSDYAPVEVALIAALRSTRERWDAAHELAWTKLFRLISDVMREGAESASTPLATPQREGYAVGMSRVAHRAVRLLDAPQRRLIAFGEGTRRVGL